jgi:hypothetical protein
MKDAFRQDASAPVLPTSRAPRDSRVDRPGAESSARVRPWLIASALVWLLGLTLLAFAFVLLADLRMAVAPPYGVIGAVLTIVALAAICLARLVDRVRVGHGPWSIVTPVRWNGVESTTPARDTAFDRSGRTHATETGVQERSA